MNNNPSSIFDDPKVKAFLIDVIRRCALTLSAWITKEYDLKTEEERERDRALKRKV